MAKEAHTPGPWEAIGTDPSEGVDCWWLVGADKRHVGTINGGQGDEVPQANARLIAAAPYMFDVLDATAADPAEMNNWSDAMIRGWAYAAARNAQATIAKISGEQQ